MAFDQPHDEAGDDVVDMFRAVARDHGDAIALVQGDRRVTFSELSCRLNRVAHALAGLGVRRGDRVALLSRNSIEAVEVFFGALVAGACIVPLPTMANAEQILAMMRDSGSKALFFDASESAVARDVASRLELVERGLVGLGGPDGGGTAYEALLRGASAEDPGIERRPGDDFNIIYSSGTTGVPKGIVHTHGMRTRFTLGCANFGFRPGAVTLVSTPLYSNTTLTAWLPSMAMGATSVLMGKFDELDFLRLSARERVTHAMLVPVQYERIVRCPAFGDHDLSSFEVKLSTSAPLRADVKRRVVDTWPGMLIEIYGLTEGGVSTVLLANANPTKLDSVGLPSPGCDIRIIDDAGNELPRGSTGEIVGHNALMMTHYENRPDETEALVWRDADGRTFLRSGDLGRFDEDGFLYLLDRKKDMIISGGFNIYATDLENVLSKHEAVREVAVIGVPSDRWGETPLAVVVRETGAEASADELLEWANARLGKGQRISAIELVGELPKSPIGKVLKRDLRAPYWRADGKA